MSAPQPFLAAPAPPHPPYDAVGLLQLPWSTGAAAYGSGALISPGVVLTCSHNLVDATKRGSGQARAVTFFQQYASASAPPQPGHPGAGATYAVYSSRYLGGDDSYDVGLVFVPTAKRVRYYFTPEVVTSTSLEGELLDIVGYPSSAWFKEWWDQDQVAPNGINLEDNTLHFTAGFTGGGSGSPIFRYDAERDVVLQFAVFVQGAGLTNVGIVFTPAIMRWLQQALTAPPPPPGTFLVGV